MNLKCGFDPTYTLKTRSISHGRYRLQKYATRRFAPSLAGFFDSGDHPFDLDLRGVACYVFDLVVFATVHIPKRVVLQEIFVRKDL